MSSWVGNPDAVTPPSTSTRIETMIMAGPISRAPLSVTSPATKASPARIAASAQATVARGPGMGL
ncbi:hypothetical protein [Nocardia salmonicida]|uniref:hypothetical protein n=1 Tax=Nocardia salmonicida TaxID=53431 RepID=UPI0037B1B168